MTFYLDTDAIGKQEPPSGGHMELHSAVGPVFWPLDPGHYFREHKAPLRLLGAIWLLSPQNSWLWSVAVVKNANGILNNHNTGLLLWKALPKEVKLI